MKFKTEKYNYNRNIKLSLIISLTLMIVLFEFFPKSNLNIKTIINIDEPIITYSDIPSTIQPSNSKTNTKPKPPLIKISDNIIEPKILDDIYVDLSSLNELNNIGVVKDKNTISGFTEINYKPRQIYEIVPKFADENIKGEVNLFLQIDSEGNVKNYKILSNTLDCPECLQKVLSAINKSKWKPAIINGRKTELWVEKKYTFN